MKNYIKDFNNSHLIDLNLATYVPYEMFGEEDMIIGKNRSFTIKCNSAGAELIFIKKRDFRHRIMCEPLAIKYIKERANRKLNLLQSKINIIKERLIDVNYKPKKN